MKALNLKSTFLFCLIVLLFTLTITTPHASAAPPKVVCVPWYPQNLAVSHDTWSGKEIALKGTAHDPDGDTDLDTYEWDFGDGSPVASGAVTNAFVVEATHTYVGSVGDIFVATLTVTDTSGESGSDNYLVTIRDGSVLSVKVNVAIDEGLWKLHKDMNRGTYGDGTDYGFFPYGGNTAAATGACVEAFEIHGHLPTGNAGEDPYVETVQRGLNYLLANTHVHAISSQPAGDPDTNGNGIGLGCYTDGGHSMYECGITLMTFASSSAPGRIAATGDATWVKGRTYSEIVQDMVDYLAFGQTDSAYGVYRGGWRYSANSGNSDNSCSQWPVIGMEAAETTFGISAPGFVESELNYWIDYIQNDASGGSGYTGPTDWVNIAKTGGLLCEMKFFGDNSSTARALAAWNYIGTRWGTDGEHFNSYYALYSVMKGFRLMGIGTTLPGGTIDWYADEYAPYLVSQQNSSGSWSGGMWSGHPLSTAWALLTLQETVFEPGPVADAGPDVANHPPIIEILFDGSGSYHLDSSKEIVLYEWDFGDGSPIESSSEPTVSHAYPAVYLPDGTTIDWDATANVYTVVLKVTDNSSSPKTDIDECIVHITPPPWPPVADPGGPYTAGKCEVITLDGSASYAPGGELYPDPEHPWHGYIVSWEWDLDNDNQYDDATGEMVEWSSCTKGLYVVGLKVTDNLDDYDAQDTVVHVANRPPVADADGPYCCSLGEITFDGSGSTDPDPDETETLQYRWDFESDGTYDTVWSTDPTAKYTYPVCQDYTATLQVKDIDGATDTDTAEVVPNQPPDSSDAYADPGCLWPPDHKFVEVDILGVTDPDGDEISIMITGITSDEPTATDPGSGGPEHAPDAAGVGTDTAQIRAERRGRFGNGRIYEIHFIASDGMGGESEGMVRVFVPHNRSGGGCDSVDDGQIYDATQIN